MAVLTGARQTGKDVAAALAKRGIKRVVSDKTVRAWVRANVAAYDDDGYTPHQYDAKTHARIVAGMVARYSRTVQRDEADARGTAASAGRQTRAKSAKSAHSARETAARKADAAPMRETRPAPSSDPS